MELVLWMPVLLFVAALIVNYGTAAAWRVRGEIASRDAAERQLTPRTGRNEPRPENWPRSNIPEDQAWAAELNGMDASQGTAGTAADTLLPNRSRAFSFPSTKQIERLDDASIQHEVVRGPIFEGFWVYPLLDPDSRGFAFGTSQLDRDYAFLPALGKYHSGSIRQPILGDTWAINRAYFSGTVPIPNEALFQSASFEAVGEFEGGVHRFSAVPNRYRRTKLLYKFPDVSHGPEQPFVSAMRELQIVHSAQGLREMDASPEAYRWWGMAHDYWPRSVVACELDRKRARQLALEGRVVDYVDPTGEVQLGGISRLPRLMTLSFFRMYMWVLIEDSWGLRSLSAEELEEIIRKMNYLVKDWKRVSSFEQMLRNREMGAWDPSFFGHVPTPDPLFSSPYSND